MNEIRCRCKKCFEAYQERDKQEDGWTRVSAVLFGFLSEKMPSELTVFEPTVEGRGRAKLTEKG